MSQNHFTGNDLNVAVAVIRNGRNRKVTERGIAFTSFYKMLGAALWEGHYESDILKENINL